MTSLKKKLNDLMEGYEWEAIDPNTGKKIYSPGKGFFTTDNPVTYSYHGGDEKPFKGNCIEQSLFVRDHYPDAKFLFSRDAKPGVNHIHVTPLLKDDKGHYHHVNLHPVKDKNGKLQYLSGGKFRNLKNFLKGTAHKWGDRDIDYYVLDDIPSEGDARSLIAYANEHADPIRIRGGKVLNKLRFKKNFDKVVDLFKKRLGIDLSNVKYYEDIYSQNKYGDFTNEFSPEESGGDWHSDHSVRINPKMEDVIKHWKLDTKLHPFTNWMIAHELAHDIESNPDHQDLVKRMIAEAKKNGFTTPYLEKVKRKYKNMETFCEYTAHLLNNKKRVKAGSLLHDIALIKTAAETNASAGRGISVVPRTQQSFNSAPTNPAPTPTQQTTNLTPQNQASQLPTPQSQAPQSSTPPGNWLYNNRMEWWQKNTWAPKYNTSGVQVDKYGVPRQHMKQPLPTVPTKDFVQQNIPNGMNPALFTNSDNAGHNKRMFQYWFNEPDTDAMAFPGTQFIAMNTQNIQHLRPSLVHHEGTHLNDYDLRYMTTQATPSITGNTPDPETAEIIRSNMMRDQVPLNSPRTYVINGKEYTGEYRLPASLQEGEAPTTYGEHHYYRQHPYDSGYEETGYRDYLRPAPKQTDSDDGSPLNWSHVPDNPDNEQYFTYATPLWYTVDKFGNNSKAERFGQWGGPKYTKDNDIGNPQYEFNSNDTRISDNLSEINKSADQARDDSSRGRYFAEREAVQRQFDPLYAMYKPIGNKNDPNVDYFDNTLQQSPYTVRELLEMASSGDQELYNKAKEWSHMLRPDLQYIINNNTAESFAEHVNEYDNVTSILNADPRFAESLEGLQFDYSVTPGFDKTTDYRTIETMDEMLERIADANTKRDELLKYMNHSDTLDASGLHSPYYIPEYNGLPGSTPAQQ